MVIGKSHSGGEPAGGGKSACNARIGQGSPCDLPTQATRAVCGYVEFADTYARTYYIHVGVREQANTFGGGEHTNNIINVCAGRVLSTGDASPREVFPLPQGRKNGGVGIRAENP